VAPEPEDGKSGIAAPEATMVAADIAGGPVTNLPFANGRTFGTLDEYLAYRRELGAMDKPFYREIKPGLYELETGRGPKAKPPQRYTRGELLELFGFAE